MEQSLHIFLLPMIAGTTKKRKPKGAMTQKEAALQLGVSRWHLNRVIRGHRESKSLTARFRQLVREHSTA